MMDNTRRTSVQSSLFSSVSLDSLERSSVHQNQLSCISPRTLSIDSLVAEELLFQLRNSDPIQTLTSEAKQFTSNKGEISNVTAVEEQLGPKKTNFAATSQLNCNEHLKMHRYAHCYMENDPFSYDPDIGKCKDENASSDVNRSIKLTLQTCTSPSENCSDNISDTQLENFSKIYSHVVTESNVDVPMQSCNYLKATVCNKHETDKNVHYSTSDDCIKESHKKDSSSNELLNHILKEDNIFENSASNSLSKFHFDCINHGSSNSSIVSNDGSLASPAKSLQHSILNNYTDTQKQMYLPENVSPTENSFCDKFINSDCHDDLFPVKELTEENLKIFNSEFEENREDVFILPPPSTFDVSEDNQLSVISNSSSFSLVCCPEKKVADVSSKSTQTDQNSQNECSKFSDTTGDTENTDLIVRMMDLMVETLKLMKDQYSQTPKKSVSHQKRKLEFPGESDKSNITDQEQMAITSPSASKNKGCLTKKKYADGKIAKYMKNVLPMNDYVLGNLNHPTTHPLSHSKKNVNEHSLNVKNKLNTEHSRTCCPTAKTPNFYTLPFDFMTSKKTPNASKFRKADALSQASVDCLPDKTRNLNSTSNEFDKLSVFTTTSATEHKSPWCLKPNYSKLGNSKSHLKHLIELRRKVVEATMGPSNNCEKVNFENHATDSLKSPSSSSEGYLSSVSSKGPFRQFSEVSTDSQESSQTMERLILKQCPQKHSVRPLDFGSQCYRDVAVSPDSRWLNTSADSGAFFLDSPGIEKKSNVEEYPSITTNRSDFHGTISPVAGTSSKRHETERPSSRHHSHFLENSINRKEEKVLPSTRFQPRDEIKRGQRQQHRKNDFYAPGFHDLDEIGENYLDIPPRESISVYSSSSSDFSFSSRKPSKNRSSAHSRAAKSSPKIKRCLSGQEVQKLLDSIENDKRVLRQLQQNHLLDRKYSPSHILPSTSSLENLDDLFYQDCYKSLPSRSAVSPLCHEV